MTLDPRETVLHVAAATTWVREIGPNRGQAVEAILRRVGLPPGQPWCAAYVAWIGWAVLARRWPLPLVGGCVSLHDASRQRGLIQSTPAVGAVFLLWSEELGRYAHTGFVVGPTAQGAWHTVEGNTSPDGSREGTGVFERVRRWGPRDRFVHWWETPTTLPLPAAA